MTKPPVYFTYTDEQWKLIEGKIGKHVDGLRASIEHKATMYIWSSTPGSPITRKRSERQARADLLRAVRKSTENYNIAAAASPNSFRGFPTFIEAADTYVDKVARYLDFLISRLDHDEPRRNNAALINRDGFWSDLAKLWVEMGGKPKGERTASFIYEATVPVVRHLSRRTPEGRRDLSQLAVVRWLERRPPKRQQ